MPEGLGPSAESSVSDRLAVTAAACDAVSARHAELVRGELDALPLERAVLAAFADDVRAEGAGIVAGLGCGEGRIGAHLAGLDVTGIDLVAGGPLSPVSPVTPAWACRYASSGVA